MRVARVRVVLVVAGLAVAPRAGLASPVDDATVRVFAIGTVGTEFIDVRGAKVQIASPVAGHGSGFFVGDSLVMTAHHVIEGARHVVVRLPADGGFVPARVAFSDKENDVAVLRVEPSGAPPPLQLAVGPPGVRRAVFAVGYPIDPKRRQPQSARGIIAGFLDNGTIQLDIALNPGNSGGPVVDELDAVVGMATARGNVEQGIQGIGYAVPVTALSSAIAAAKRASAVGSAPTGPALTPPGLTAPQAASAPSPGANATDASGQLARDSATVVDELIQHGALWELRKIDDASERAFASDLDQALTALIDRTQDPDLLVYVGAAMWNAALVVAYSDPARRPASWPRDRARVLTGQLRDGAVVAVRRAVARDPGVRARSAFVGAVLAIAGEQAGPGSSPARAALARPLLLALQAAPMIRYNPASGGTAIGFGGELRFAVRQGQSSTDLTFAIAAGEISFLDKKSNGIFTQPAAITHQLLAGDFGVAQHFGPVELRAAFGVVLYRSAVEDLGGTFSASDLTASARLGAGYVVGRLGSGDAGSLELGAGLRVLSGPTVWIEPIYGALRF